MGAIEEKPIINKKIVVGLCNVQSWEAIAMLGAGDSGRYDYICIVIWLEQHANMAVWLYWLLEKQKIQIVVGLCNVQSWEAIEMLGAGDMPA